MLLVVIPYHRPLHLLEATLRSVRTAQARAEAQGFSAPSVVILDDSGAPGAPGALARLVEPYGYSVLRGAGGMAATWNRALELGFERGLRAPAARFLQIVHADDELEPDYFVRLLRHLQSVASNEGHGVRAPEVWISRPEHVLIMDERSKLVRTSLADWAKAFLFPLRARLRGMLAGEAVARALARANTVVCPTAVYDLRALRALPGFEPSFAAQYRFVLDVEFWVRLLRSGGCMGVFPQAMGYRYRRHREATTALLSQTDARLSEELRFARSCGVLPWVALVHAFVRSLLSFVRGLARG